MKKYYYLYQITNNLNGKIYVGVHQTKNINDGYMGSGKVINRAIEKHGIENFTKVILETFENAEAMYAREKEVVTDEFLERDDVYNLRRGGNGGFDYLNKTGNRFSNLKNPSVRAKTTVSLKHRHATSGFTLAELRGREQMKATLKEKFATGELQNGFKGKTHSAETKRVMSLRKKDRLLSPEDNSQFGTCWISHELVGSKKCKKQALPYYIDQGWVKGRNIFRSQQ